MSASKLPMYELTTTIHVEGVHGADRIPFVERFARAIFRKTEDFPMVLEFFVAPDERTDADIAVGLRFQKIDARYIEDIATEVLDEAMALLAEEDGKPAPAMEREASALVFA